ncbi:hypothetical protein BS78_05G203900 [Paspalum vaginatum]|nr:hypothetical protein BS78_05G203900 [Paspalum vaginatum]
MAHASRSSPFTPGTADHLSPSPPQGQCARRVTSASSSRPRAPRTAALGVLASGLRRPQPRRMVSAARPALRCSPLTASPHYQTAKLWEARAGHEAPRALHFPVRYAPSSRRRGGALELMAIDGFVDPITRANSEMGGVGTTCIIKRGSTVPSRVVGLLSER